MTRFVGKVVIVTGAGSGIGAATARRFLSEGASVVLNGRRREMLVATADGYASANVLVHNGDVSDNHYVQTLVDATASRYGRIDVLVNNAGISSFGPILSHPVEDWHQVLRVNLDGVYLATRAALPYLLETRGSIVNVSSVSGLGGDWYTSSYSAAKGAVSNLTRALALELGMQGVRVNAVAPSLTLTEMTATLAQSQPLIDMFMERIPLGRVARPEEIASVIAFLASEDAAFVNGVNLPVDGGVTASNGQPNATAVLSLLGMA